MTGLIIAAVGTGVVIATLWNLYIEPRDGTGIKIINDDRQQGDTMTPEGARLCEAVDEFAMAMKERLCQKATKGYTGWDGEYPTPKLQTEIAVDAQEKPHPSRKHCADMANRAMMLWRRADW